MKCSWLVQRLELIKRQFHLQLQLGNPTWKLQLPEVRDAETSDAIPKLELGNEQRENTYICHLVGVLCSIQII